MFYFLYTTATGAIVAVNTSGFAPGTGEAVVSFDQATASAAVQGAYLNPSRYLMQGSPVEPALQPYLTLAVAEASGVYTVTATLNNPPATPPTDATFTVAGATYTEAISSNTATLALQIHPTIAGQQVTVSVSATGIVGASTTIGTAQPLIGQQSWTDSSGVNWVGPGGAGSTAYVMGANAATVSQADQANAIAVALGEVLHLLHDKIVPALQAATYTPLALTADETNALNDLTANVIPTIVTTLDAIYPSGGTEMPTYARMKAAMTSIQTVVKDTNAGLSAIPNLQ